MSDVVSEDPSELASDVLSDVLSDVTLGDVLVLASEDVLDVTLEGILRVTL